MKTIKIETAYNKNFTSIPNFFIDQFMGDANGDFVKVYIWLIKQVDHGSQDISIEHIADAINFTEADVIRAIKYWEKLQVIEATWDRRTLESIMILDHPSAETYQRKEAPTTKTMTNTPAPTPLSKVIAEQKPNYSTKEIVTFKDNEEFKQLIFIAETYIGKVLNESDLQTIISFHQWLKLPFDVIEFLIEYCVSNNKRSLRYMEKIAVDWSENEIDTIEKAKWKSENHSSQYYTVFNALGIKDRHPVEKETKLMDKWIKAFPPQIIKEACNRTITSTNKPSLSYTDSILNAWRDSGVKTLDDIEALDVAFKQKKELEAKSKLHPNNNKTKSSKKFINYEQRDYDYADIEAQALRKLMSQDSEGK